MAGLENVWICALDLQLIRADRIISLLIPIAAGYGAASPDDQALHQAVCAEIEGGTGSERLTRVKLADCGTSPAGQLLADLAAALGSAAAATHERCLFVFAQQDPAGVTRWATKAASRGPAAEHSIGRQSRGLHEITACPARGSMVGGPQAAASDPSNPCCWLRPGLVVSVLGAEWEPRSTVGCGQKLSDAVTVAV